jgi:hypothetical protein
MDILAGPLTRGPRPVIPNLEPGLGPIDRARPRSPAAPRSPACSARPCPAPAFISCAAASPAFLCQTLAPSRPELPCTATLAELRAPPRRCTRPPALCHRGPLQEHPRVVRCPLSLFLLSLSLFRGCATSPASTARHGSLPAPTVDQSSPLTSPIKSLSPLLAHGPGIAENGRPQRRFRASPAWCAGGAAALSRPAGEPPARATRNQWPREDLTQVKIPVN